MDGIRTTGAIATTSTKGAGRFPLLLHAPLRQGLDGRDRGCVMCLGCFSGEGMEGYGLLVAI